MKKVHDMFSNFTLTSTMNDGPTYGRNFLYTMCCTAATNKTKLTTVAKNATVKNINTCSD